MLISATSLPDELAPSHFESTDEAGSARAAEIHVAISSATQRGGRWPRVPPILTERLLQ